MTISMNVNVGTSGGDKPDPTKPIDPLFWHYQRESRLSIAGAVGWDHNIPSKNRDRDFVIRCNFSFISNASYLDVLVPSSVLASDMPELLGFVRQNARLYASTSPIGLKIPVLRMRASMKFDEFPEHEMGSEHCVFTGRIFLYTMLPLNPADKDRFVREYEETGLRLVIRDGTWITAMQKFIDRPVVFLGHDSSDKDVLVRELAHSIDEKEIKVWYDEISLRPGSRLRKSLDAALEDADYFMPIVTENFLSNTRFAEYELDAILQKYITEKKPIIVPICVGIDPSRLKEKSRVLADFVAIVHRPSDPISALVKQIVEAVDPRIPQVGTPLPPMGPPKKEGLFSVALTVGSKEQAPQTPAPTK